MIEKSAEKARQGETRNEVRWILLISLAAIVIAMAVVLTLFVNG